MNASAGPSSAAHASQPGAPATGGFAEGTIIGDHFVLRRRLGGGGMGEVYLAENLNVSGKKYAIKVLRPEFSNKPMFDTMLLDEASKQARLSHDNVVGMYDFFRWSGHCCLLQTYVKGKTLEDMLAEQPGGLEREQALTLMIGVLSGLDHAHKEGILHCDVKPGNVIVDTDGRPRVTDFGISRDIGTRTGLRGAGTPAYMSPEQCDPPYEIDHRTDVFSAGVMFFQMLCGRLPFDATGPGMPQTSTDAPDIRLFRPDVPEPIARIVATALQRDPAQRFQGCGDFERAIVEHRKRERWRRTWLPAIVVTSILAVIGAIALYEWRKHVDDEVRAAALANQQRAIALAAAKEKTVAEAVRNANIALNAVCRESIEYGIKKRGVATAISSGLPDIARQLEERLASLRDSITDQAAAYDKAMRQLANEDAALVAKGLAGQVGVVAAMMSADDAALRAGRGVPELDQLLSRCPPPREVPKQ